MKSKSEEMHEVYQGVRTLITHPGTWTQGAEARDDTGQECNPCSDEAVAYCLAGAVRHVIDPFFNYEIELQRLVIRKIAKMILDEDHPIFDKHGMRMPGDYYYFSEDDAIIDIHEEIADPFDVVACFNDDNSQDNVLRVLDVLMSE